MTFHKVSRVSVYVSKQPCNPKYPKHDYFLLLSLYCLLSVRRLFVMNLRNNTRAAAINVSVSYEIRADFSGINIRGVFDEL